MKKNILIILYFIFLTNLSAQSFGLKTGALNTTFSGPDTENITSRKGLYIGAFTKLGEGSILFMPELVFHKRGADEVAETGAFIMNYIDLNVNGLFHFTDELSLVIGPYIAIAVSGTKHSNIDDKIENIRNWDSYNRLDFGSNLGGMYQISDLLHVNLTYSIGFVDVWKEEGLRNSSIQLGVGYVFGY
jgi:hypothetical protein